MKYLLAVISLPFALFGTFGWAIKVLGEFLFVLGFFTAMLIIGGWADAVIHTKHDWLKLYDEVRVWR